MRSHLFCLNISSSSSASAIQSIGYSLAWAIICFCFYSQSLSFADISYRHLVFFQCYSEQLSLIRAASLFDLVFSITTPRALSFPYLMTTSFSPSHSLSDGAGLMSQTKQIRLKPLGASPSFSSVLSKFR